jgi:predicted transcriptional regulator
MRGALVVLGALAFLPAALAANTVDLESASGHFRITTTVESVPVRAHAAFAPYGPHDQAAIGTMATVPSGGWGACAGMQPAPGGMGGGTGGTCICPAGLSTCPPGSGTSDLTYTVGPHTLTSTHRRGPLQATHEWKPHAGHPDFVEATVTLSNLGPTTLSDLRYRSVWPAHWVAEGVAPHATARTADGLVPAPRALEFTSDLAGISALPRDPFTQRAQAEPGSLCPAPTLGPGSASNGAYFQDSQTSQGCAPGATVQLRLGSLGPGGSVSFQMLFGRADDEKSASALVPDEALGLDLQILAEEPSQPGVAYGTPVTHVWGFKGLRAIDPDRKPGGDGGSGGGHFPPPAEAAPDSDHDGVQDVADNCPAVANDQADRDGDQVGDACDDESGPEPAGPAAGAPPRGLPPGTEQVGPDQDGDGRPDAWDLCPAVPERVQADLDGDGLGDACDPDRDGDRIADQLVPPGTFLDNCPLHLNPDQRDSDGDGIGDACQPAPGLASPAKPRSALLSVAQQVAPGLASPGFLLAVGGLVAVAALHPRSRSWLSAFGLALFTRLADEDVLGNPNRSLVFELVQAAPGIHAEELARSANLSRGTTLHHVRVLERSRRVKTIRAAGRLMVFPSGTGLAPPGMEQLAVYHPSAKRVLELVRTEPGIAMRELARRAGMRYGTARYHVKRFESMGWVRMDDADGLVRVHPAEAVALAAASG